MGGYFKFFICFLCILPAYAVYKRSSNVDGYPYHTGVGRARRGGVDIFTVSTGPSTQVSSVGGKTTVTSTLRTTQTNAAVSALKNGNGSGSGSGGGSGHSGSKTTGSGSGGGSSGGSGNTGSKNTGSGNGGVSVCGCGNIGSQTTESGARHGGNSSQKYGISKIVLLLCILLILVC